MTYVDKYNNYVEFLESGGMKIYNNAMKIYLDKNPSQLCPGCSKPGIIKKVLPDGKIEMKCKDPKCGWNLTIDPPKSLNLYNKLDELNKQTVDLLYILITEQGTFKVNKEKYLKSKNVLDEIKDVFRKQKEMEDKIDKERYELSNNLMELYYRRKHVFKDINTKINTKKTKFLINLSKNEKEINDQRLSQVSKQLELPKEDVGNVLGWLNICKKYIYIQTKLDKTLENIKDEKKIMKDMSQNFMVTLPIVMENKKITVKKGGTIDTIEKMETSPIEELDDDEDDEKETETDEDTEDEIEDEKEKSIEDEKVKTDIEDSDTDTEDTDTEDEDEEELQIKPKETEITESIEKEEEKPVDDDIKIVKIRAEDMIPKMGYEEELIEKTRVPKFFPQIIPTSGKKKFIIKKFV